MKLNQENVTLEVMKGINLNFKRRDFMIKINGEKLEITKFPNGESLIKTTEVLKDIKDLENIIEMTVKFESDEDLIHMMFIKKHLDEMNLDAILKIPYMPYSRMDRTEGENIFTLKYICSLINSLKTID